MPDFKITGVEDTLKRLTEIEKRQVPFATKNALNKISEIAKKDLVKEMKKVFNKPVNYTLNSVRIKYATKTRLKATVWLKDKAAAGKGTPATSYLAPQIFGGPRKAKRHEKILRAKGILRGRRQYTAVGLGAKKNKAGNLSPAEYVKLLSETRSFTEIGYTSNKKIGKTLKYFSVRRDTKKLKSGIFKRVGKGKIRPILKFIAKPNYEKRFKFFERARKTYNRQYKRIFENELNKALRTAR